MATAGFGRGTPVATLAGWRAAAELRAGDTVLTVAAGPRRIWSIRPVPPRAPLLVPPQALDNREALLLMPGQLVLIETDLADELYGDRLALLPAAALQGWRGIRALNGAPSAVALCLEEPQLIYAGGAVLLACPGRDGGLAGDLPAFPLSQARHLVACLMAADLGRALRAARPPYAAV